jgi:hypothetical protein
MIFENLKDERRQMRQGGSVRLKPGLLLFLGAWSWSDKSLVPKHYLVIPHPRTGNWQLATVFEMRSRTRERAWQNRGMYTHAVCFVAVDVQRDNLVIPLPLSESALICVYQRHSLPVFPWSCELGAEFKTT